MNLLSHPNRLLTEHLEQTALNALKLFENKKFDFCIFGTNFSNIIKDLVFISAISHDVGKATIFFQDYLNGKKVNDNKKKHSLLSAVFALFIAQNYFQNKDLSYEKILLSSFVFSVVKHHHGKPVKLIDNFVDDATHIVIKEQIKSIENPDFISFLDKKLSPLIKSLEWQNFVKFVENRKYNDFLDTLVFDVYEEDFFRKLSIVEKLKLYFIHQFVFSALIYGDKKNVIVSEQIQKGDINIEESIEKYRIIKSFNIPKFQIDELKNKAYLDTLENLDKIFNSNQHIYSLTLPTGMGKTILALRVAEKIRQKTGLNNSKIIITVPFTSIIDQNFEVYAEVLGQRNSNIILKHTHLSKIQYETEDFVLDYEQSKFLIETWNSQIIVTTFVQLLETFLDNDKTKLMRFANIANSVVVLDEIQTIPYEIWKTICETFKILGQMFNIYFVLSTATQPFIFEPQKEIFELVPDHKDFFKYFNRTKLIIRNFSRFEDFKQEVLAYVEENSEKDVLIVMNTKNKTKDLFIFLRESIDLTNNEIYYLTTFITPYERKKIIKRIRQKNKKRKIIVSTQLIEAGVDISVDTVFRQLSPIDSIIQSAGRANRYNEKETISEVIVCDIEDLRNLSSRVYGVDLIVKTQNVLKQYETIEERDFLELIEKYYFEVRKHADNTTQNILESMKELDFGSVNWKLIEEQKTESIFVALNETAKEIWNKFIEIFQNNAETWEKEKLFAEIKNDFYDFVVNVPVPFDSKSIDFDGEKKFGFYLWLYDNPTPNYVYDSEEFSKNTGYSPNKKTTEFI